MEKKIEILIKNRILGLEIEILAQQLKFWSKKSRLKRWNPARTARELRREKHYGNAALESSMLIYTIFVLCVIVLSATLNLQSDFNVFLYSHILYFYFFLLLGFFLFYFLTRAFKLDLKWFRHNKGKKSNGQTPTQHDLEGRKKRAHWTLSEMSPINSVFCYTLRNFRIGLCVGELLLRKLRRWPYPAIFKNDKKKTGSQKVCPDFLPTHLKPRLDVYKSISKKKCGFIIFNWSISRNHLIFWTTIIPITENGSDDNSDIEPIKYKYIVFFYNNNKKSMRHCDDNITQKRGKKEKYIFWLRERKKTYWAGKAVTTRFLNYINEFIVMLVCVPL